MKVIRVVASFLSESFDRNYQSMALKLNLCCLRWFAAEIIGSVLDLEPRRWRKPRRMDHRQNKGRVQKFQKGYAKFDWTGMIGK